MVRRAEACTTPDFSQRASKPRFVKEHQSIERLILRRRRDAALDRPIGEKSADLGFTHLTWVPFAMAQDEPLDPAQIGILGADTEVLHPNRAAHLLQEWGGACRWPMWRILPGASTLHECAVIDFGTMGNIGNLPGTGLGCNALTERGLPGAGAFSFAPENGWAWGGKRGMRKNSVFKHGRFPDTQC